MKSDQGDHTVATRDALLAQPGYVQGNARRYTYGTEYGNESTALRKSQVVNGSRMVMG